MEETDSLKKRKNWRRFMYGYNTVMCLSAGPPMVLFPGFTRKLLNWPYEDPVMMGIYGSIVTSVGALSASALLDESKQDKYVPLFMVQIMYKSATCALIANRLRKKEASSWGTHFILWFFVLYIVLLAGAIASSEDGGND
jgi:hypothetical protein